MSFVCHSHSASFSVILRNFSQCYALYCLGLFYVILHDELAAIRPVAKFVVIKIVVILMWDQQVLVAALEKDKGSLEAEKVRLQAALDQALCALKEKDRLLSASGARQLRKTCQN